MAIPCALAFQVIGHEMHRSSRRTRCQVLLNVYDLSPNNQWLHMVGMGAYHTGVELYGVEYSFGHHENGPITGVFENPPRQAVGCVFRQQIVLGETDKSLAEVQRVIDTLRPQFLGNEYHILTRNCNHFSDALSKALLGRGIPGYLNRLAGMGQCCSCFLPKEMQQPAGVPVAEAESRPLVHAANFKPFSGVGQTLLVNSNQRGALDADTPEQRRERVRQAAMSRVTRTLKSPEIAEGIPSSGPSQQQQQPL